MTISLPASFDVLVADEAAGAATPEGMQTLRAAPAEHRQALHRLLADTRTALAGARDIIGPERDQVVADLEAERSSLAGALHRLTGEPMDREPPEDGGGPDHGRRPEPPSRRDSGDGRRFGTGSKSRAGANDQEPAPATEEPVLQASFHAGRIVLWAGGPAAEAGRGEQLDRLIGAAGASTVEWQGHSPVPVPGRGRSAARSARLDRALGWLVAVAAGRHAGTGAGSAGAGAGRAGAAEEAGAGYDPVGPSVHWLAEVAVWATELVAAGRMVPTLRRSQRQPVAPANGHGRSGHAGGSEGGTPAGKATFGVRWAPALVDPERVRALTQRMPGSVATLQPAGNGSGLCRALLTAAVGSICREGANRLVAPALPPLARTETEVSEAFLASLGGAPFQASGRAGDELARDLKRWSAPVLAEAQVWLVVTLDPPEDDGGWLCSVEAAGVERHPMSVDQALVAHSPAKAGAVASQLARLERMLPALRRPGGNRRGQVVLGTDEAWELMTDIGPALRSAGFEVRVPALARRRPSPRLRLTTEPGRGRSEVGAQQLCSVRWSVLFDDVELDAAEIARLAGEARPLVKAKGRWVELDRADLAEAAAA
ncbi:MAG: SNF2 helicase-associated domain-containing protein, partial [Acidimicrobiales bacterium]